MGHGGNLRHSALASRQHSYTREASLEVAFRVPSDPQPSRGLALTPAILEFLAWEGVVRVRDQCSSHALPKQLHPPYLAENQSRLWSSR